MTYCLDHAAQELMKRGYIRRLDKTELYDFALRAHDQLVDFFAVLGGRPVFDTDVEIIGLRRLDSRAAQDRAESLQADSATGLFRGHALSFNRAVVMWFFRKQLDSDLDAGAERTWMTLEEVIRGVAAYYPEDLKEDEAKFSRALSKSLSFLVNNDLVETHNSPRGEVWAAHPALRVALGADEMEAFTSQILEVLSQAGTKDRQEDAAPDGLTAANINDPFPMDPDHPDSPLSANTPKEDA